MLTIGATHLGIGGLARRPGELAEEEEEIAAEEEREDERREEEEYDD